MNGGSVRIEVWEELYGEEDTPMAPAVTVTALGYSVLVFHEHFIHNVSVNTYIYNIKR